MCCCSAGVAKAFLVIVNILFVLGGCGVLTIGIIIQVDGQLLFRIPSLASDSDNEIVFGVAESLTSVSVPGMLIANAFILVSVGMILTILGIIGCCGACKKTSCLLNFYCTVITIMIVLEAGIGMWSLMNVKLRESVYERIASTVKFLMLNLNWNLSNGGTPPWFLGNKVDTTQEDRLVLAMSKKYETGLHFSAGQGVMPSDPDELAIDRLQLELACCGSVNHTEWMTNLLWDNSYSLSDGSTVNPAQVPASCCARKESALGYNFTNVNEVTFEDLKSCLEGTESVINTMGCHTVLYDVIRSNQIIMLASFSALIAVQFLAVICGCCLKKASSDNKIAPT